MSAPAEGEHIVWYASYGSNMALDRFMCYIAGGRVAGMQHDCVGCRTDPRPPLRSTWLSGNYALCFRGHSKTWGGGGVAFVDFFRPTNFMSILRAHLVRFPQFNSVVAQENGNDATMELSWGAVERMARLGVGSYVVLSQERKYGCLVYLGHVDGYPVLTFTCPPDTIDAELVPPSEAYASVLVRGLAGGGMPESDARGYVDAHIQRTAHPEALDPGSRPRLPHALPHAAAEGAGADRLSAVGPAVGDAGTWGDGPTVVAAQALASVHTVVGSPGAQTPASPSPSAAGPCLAIRCHRAAPVDRDLSLRALLPWLTARLVGGGGAAQPSLLATGDEAGAAPAAVVQALAATAEQDLRLTDYQLAADPGADAWRVCFARYWRELPPAPPTCISCDPEAVVAGSEGESGPVVRAKDLSLPEHSNALAHAWLDAQQRPMLVVTPQRHVESFTELSQEEADALWAVVDDLVRAGGEGDIGNWRAHVNAGRYRNLRHLHVKLSPPPAVFDEVWGAHPGLKRAAGVEVTKAVAPGR